jgi:hypothetical protein
MIGKVWSGGFHFEDSEDGAKPLAQAFFYPNSTIAEPVAETIDTSHRAVTKCIQNMYTIRTNYLGEIKDKVTQRQFRYFHFNLFLV